MLTTNKENKCVTIMESKTMTLEEQFKEEKKIEAYEDNRMQPKVYSEIYVEWLEEQLTLTDVVKSSYGWTCEKCGETVNGI